MFHDLTIFSTTWALSNWNMSHHVWLLWYNSNHAMPNSIDRFG